MALHDIQHAAPQIPATPAVQAAGIAVYIGSFVHLLPEFFAIPAGVYYTLLCLKLIGEWRQKKPPHEHPHMPEPRRND